MLLMAEMGHFDVTHGFPSNLFQGEIQEKQL